MRQRVAAIAGIAVGLVCLALPERAGEVLLHGSATRAATLRVVAALERNQDTVFAISAAKGAVAFV